MVRYISLLLFFLTIVQTQVGIKHLGINELEIRESFKILFQSDKIIHATPHVTNLIRNGTNGLTNSEIKRLELIGLYPVGENIVARTPVDLDQSYDTEHFRFYYILDESSDDAVENDEYVTQMGQVFEQVWTFYMDTLEFEPPPSDPDAAHDLYEVYLENLPTYYFGVTYTINANISDPACVSYIRMRNNYSGNQFSNHTELENIKVTAVHEFFHSIQFGYNCFERLWLMEATAVWSEDELYNGINDLYRYMPSWFANPDKAIINESSHMYGSFIYFQYIDEHLGGPGTIKACWDNSNALASPVNDISVAAVDAALEPYNSSFEDAYIGMCIANRILSSTTGSGIYSYEEADGYRTVVSEPAVYSYLSFSMDDTLTETSNHLPLYASDYWTMNINDPVNIELNNISGSSDVLSLIVVAKLFGQNEWMVQFGDSIDIDSQIGFDWISIVVVAHGNDANNWDYELILTDVFQELTVYSGDTDNNGVVNGYDVLPIGIYFHDVGVAHDSVSYVWEPRTVPSFENIAATYADANGDGIVDEKDVIGIGVNWGNTHENGNTIFTINLNDLEMINEHKKSFRKIYNSIKGENQSAIAMRALLSELLGDVVPIQFELHQNYPNPFNPVTKLRYDLPEDANVNITIYDMMGRVVSNLVSSQQKAGFKSVEWNATDYFGKPVSAGVYIYQIRAGEFVQTRKMVLLK